MKIDIVAITKDLAGRHGASDMKSKCIKTLICFFTLGTFVMTAGCSTNVSRFQMPGTDLAQVRILYVVPPDNEREATELRSLIESNLEQRGYQVRAKDASTKLGEGEFIFDYATDWHWDITWYLLELRVAIYDPTDNTLIAQAHSKQTSLVRKNIDVVVDRVMASLFDDPQVTNGD